MTRALTLHAGWAHAVAHLGKDVENRTWAPPKAILGQRIAIHAGSTRGVFDAPGAVRSAIVATAVVREVVTASESRWWIGPVGWVLSDVRALRNPVPCSGALKLWTLTDEIAALVAAEDAANAER